MNKEVTSDEVFVILSKIMDETSLTGENDAYKIFNEFQLIVEEKLIPSIESVQYEKKYQLINEIKSICKEINIYLSFPGLIKTTVIGIHKPSEDVYKNIFKTYMETIFGDEYVDKSFWKTFLNRIGNSKNKSAVSDKIPSFIFNGQIENEVIGLNIGEKIIKLTNMDYLNLVSYSKEEKFDLASILYGFSFFTDKVKQGQSYVVIPGEVDTNQKYYSAITSLIDTLLISAKNINTEDLSEYDNLSKIIVFGKCTKENKNTIMEFCKGKGISVEFTSSFIEATKLCENDDTITSKNNLCFCNRLENILYEISWYLSTRISVLTASLDNINDNLLFKDDSSYECVKQLQGQYSEGIDEINKINNSYMEVCTELLAKIDEIQLKFNVKENRQLINNHIPSMEIILLDLLIKYAEYTKVFNNSNNREKVRYYADLYDLVSKNKVISKVICNDSFGETNDVKDLEAFNETKIKSSFFIRKKINIYEEDSLDLQKVADLINELNEPLSAYEHYLLGKYYYQIKDNDKAKSELNTALEEGYLKAGELLVDSFKIDFNKLKKLGDVGVAKAAYLVGKKMYDKYINNTEDNTIDDCIRYLNIAASQYNMDAIRLLGDINYELGFEDEENDNYDKKALNLYLILVNKTKSDNIILDRVGQLYYRCENYKEAISYFEKTTSAEGYYMLGIMYENGNGVASDNKKALSYYEKAIDAGHTEAQVAYERLNAKIAEAQKKTVVSNNTSYRSYTYYGRSYYSSYYSGSSSGW